MSAVPAAVLALLQKQSMIGADKPMHEISIVAGTERELMTERILGWNTPSDGTNGGISNPVRTTDGRYLCSWIASATVMLGYTDDEITLLTENYTMSSVVDSGVTVFAGGRTSMFRRSDGKILMFVNNLGTKELGSSVDAYISDTGNGDDFVLYSNIMTRAANTSHSPFDYTFPPIEIDIIGGKRLVFVFGHCYRDGGFNRQSVYVYTSDNDGLNWTQRYSRETLTFQTQGLGQPAQLPDDSIVFTLIAAGGATRFYRSTNDAESFVRLDNMGHHGMYCGALYYDEPVDKAYRLARDGSLDYLLYEIDNPTWARFIVEDSWVKLADLSGFGGALATHETITLLPSGRLAATRLSSGTVTRILGFDVMTSELTAKSISISRNKGQASNLTITFDNKDGKYSPDKAEYNQVLWPGNEIEIKQGYGANLIETFTGLIDRVSIKSFPQEVEISARDKLKLALDQTITDAGGSHVIEYTDELVEDIFKELCGFAGISYGTVDSTTIRLTHTFIWETYGDAFSLLADLAWFTVTADEYGVVHFKHLSTRQPEHEQSVTLDDDGGTQPWYALEKTPGVFYSEIVKDSAETTTYERDTDYEMDYSPMSIKRIDGGLINDGDTVKIWYVYPKYTFTEGVDLISTQMDISDSGLYYTVVVHGEAPDGTVIEAKEDWASASFFGVLEQKIMKIDVGDAGDTQAKCDSFAARALIGISTKSRIVHFAAIAVPWLTVGDNIMILESTMYDVGTTALIYTITDLSFHQSAEGFTMTGEAYFRAYAPMPEVT